MLRFRSKCGCEGRRVSPVGVSPYREDSETERIARSPAIIDNPYIVIVKLAHFCPTDYPDEEHET